MHLTQEEFLPNKELNKSKKSADRYCHLVKTYCTSIDQLYPAKGETAFLNDLKTVYHSHRSGFVHGGKEVSIASDVADRVGLDRLGHIVAGKEVVTPGLKWFFKVTRRTLLGFLTNFPRNIDAPNFDILADIHASAGDPRHESQVGPAVPAEFRPSRHSRSYSSLPTCVERFSRK